jgi:hypothetical protein
MLNAKALRAAKIVRRAPLLRGIGFAHRASLLINYPSPTASALS